LPHCCLAVASQNLGSEEGDSCEQMLSAMHYALGSYLEESAPRRGRGSPRNGASPVCSGSSPGDAKSVIPRSRRDRAEDSGLSRASRLHRWLRLLDCQCDTFDYRWSCGLSDRHRAGSHSPKFDCILLRRMPLMNWVRGNAKMTTLHKTAPVTGASCGNGRATAAALA